MVFRYKSEQNGASFNFFLEKACLQKAQINGNEW